MAVAVEDNAVTDEEEDFDEEELVVGCSTRFHSSGVTCEVARYHAYDVVWSLEKHDVSRFHSDNMETRVVPSLHVVCCTPGPKAGVG